MSRCSCACALTLKVNRNQANQASQLIRNAVPLLVGLIVLRFDTFHPGSDQQSCPYFLCGKRPRYCRAAAQQQQCVWILLYCTVLYCIEKRDSRFLLHDDGEEKLSNRSKTRKGQACMLSYDKSYKIHYYWYTGTGTIRVWYWFCVVRYSTVLVVYLLWYNIICTTVRAVIAR